MSIGALISRILLEVKADVSDAKAKLKDLTGEQKRQQEQLIASMERSNKSIDTSVKNLGLYAAGFGALKAGIGLAKDGLEEYAKTSDKAEKTVKELEASLDSSFRDVKVAIGETVAAMAPLVSAIAKVASGFLQAAAAAARLPAQLLSGENPFSWDMNGRRGSGNMSEFFRGQERYIAESSWDAPLTDAQKMANNLSIEDQKRLLDPWNTDGIPTMGSRISGAIEKMAAAYQGRKFQIEQAKKYQAEHGVNVTEAFRYGGPSLPIEYRDQSISGLTANEPGMFEKLNAALAGDRMKGLESRIDSTKNANQISYLERIFGPTEQFDIYTRGFEALSGAVESGLSAWIDGSEGAGAAIKKFTSGLLKSLALEGATNALKYLALAASYAVTPGMQFWVPGALKAAAAWGGVAVAAGVGASQLGGGGSGSGGGSGGGYSPTQTGLGAGNSGAAGGRQITIVYGDSFADDSPHKRQEKAKRIVASALGSGAMAEE